MTMHRRGFLQTGAAVAAAAMLPRTASAAGAFNPAPQAWRNFQVVTRLEIANQAGRLQAWIPVPSVNEDAWFRSLDSTWTSNAKSAALVHDPASGAAFVHAEWSEGESAPVVEVTSRISTRDRAIDLAAPGSATLSDAERKRYTAGTELIPVDGIVKQTADKITAGATSELDKARAIYEWIVDNTFRDAKTRGCGSGDIAAMLKTGNLGGKCADLNALFVGLARASGLPARDIYGIRVAASRFGYKSLGANADIITKAQHCRAEAFLTGYGWMAMDPADVRKVVLEEPPGNLPAADAKVADARKTLFGAWEGNWLAYNMAGDIALPGSSGPKVAFLMYPQAEGSAGRLDCLDADNFKYVITAKEIVA